MSDYTPTTEEEMASTMTDRYPPIKDCDICNMNGPELPTSLSALLDLHRASHDLMLAIAEPIAQPFIDFFERCARWMTEIFQTVWRTRA